MRSNYGVHGEVIITTAQSPGISAAVARLFWKGWPSAGAGSDWSKQEGKRWKTSPSLCPAASSNSLQVKFSSALFRVLCRACFLPPLVYLMSLTEPCPISMSNSCELPHVVSGPVNWTVQTRGIWYIAIGTYVVKRSHSRMTKNQSENE